MNDERLQNTFSIDEYRRILRYARDHGYEFMTVRGFVEQGCPQKGALVLRHDLDKTPAALDRVLKAELAEGARSTVFFRVAGAEYNPIGYRCVEAMKFMQQHGFEAGLHSNCVEFAAINGLRPQDVLSVELTLLRSIIDVVGVAPHRDINYMFNTLPWLEKNWSSLTLEHSLTYQSYEKRILDNVTYVAETFNPHLCWRNDPYEAMTSCRSVYMLTHPHWWYDQHAFEDQP